LLTAILTGGLEPSIALRAGHLIVDNLPKLVVFAQAFKLDKKVFQIQLRHFLTSHQAFEQFKSKVKIAPSVEDIQQQQQDTTAIGQTLCKYFGEVLGTKFKKLWDSKNFKRRRKSSRQDIKSLQQCHHQSSNHRTQDDSRYQLHDQRRQW
jgi:hypothetical protein